MPSTAFLNKEQAAENAASDAINTQPPDGDQSLGFDDGLAGGKPISKPPPRAKDHWKLIERNMNMHVLLTAYKTIWVLAVIDMSEAS